MPRTANMIRYLEFNHQEMDGPLCALYGGKDNVIPMRLEINYYSGSGKPDDPDRLEVIRATMTDDRPFPVKRLDLEKVTEQFREEYESEVDWKNLEDPT